MRPPFILPAFEDKIISTTRLSNAEIHWDGNQRPRSREFEDIYFSSGDPLAETTHVFLEGNRLAERFATADRPFIIGECGFGFGMNFLLTWQLFNRAAPTGSTLHYLSSELHPILKQDLEKFSNSLPDQLQVLAGKLLSRYPHQGEGLHRLTLNHAGNTILLDLLYGDTLACFRSLRFAAPQVDAWYMDGFAPSCNADMWNESLCNVIAELSSPGATLATYSAAGHVRKNLENAGFTVEKIPGHGNKRHMLTGALNKQASGSYQGWDCPWQRQGSGEMHANASVAIIGAGLAGCATASALARKGVKVTLFDRNDSVAAATSGNPRGIVHFNPSRQLDAACRFRLHAYTYAVQHYQQLSEEADFGWHPAGVLQLAVSSEESHYQEDLLAKGLFDNELMQAVDAATTSRMANMKLDLPGLVFPHAGSLDPAALCHAWTSSSNIHLCLGAPVIEIAQHENRWRVTTKGEISGAGDFDAIVLCTNHETPALRLAQGTMPDYPLQLNHGQVSSFTMKDNPTIPEAILCHQGYLIPWEKDGTPMLTVGGSFDVGQLPLERDNSLLAKNLLLVRKISPEIEQALSKLPDHVVCRSGTRCSTPDYLPLAGPVEDTAACEDIFSGYRRNARKAIRNQPEYIPNLFINRGLGSSGLTTAPLLGEYMASLICRAPLPLTQKEIPAIHPLRYLIREMKRQQ